MIQSRSALAMTAVGSASGSPWASRNEQRTNRRLPTRIAGCSVLRSSPISQHCSRRDRARIGYRCFVPPVLRPGRSTAWTRSVRIRFFSSADYFIVLKVGGRRFPQVGLGIRIEGASSKPRRRPPLLGEHSEEVLREILGYDDAKLEELRRQDII